MDLGTGQDTGPPLAPAPARGHRDTAPGWGTRTSQVSQDHLWNISDNRREDAPLLQNGGGEFGLQTERQNSS